MRDAAYFAISLGAFLIPAARSGLCRRSTAPFDQASLGVLLGMKLAFLDRVGSLGALLAAVAAPCCFPLFAAVGTAVGFSALGQYEGVILYIFQGFALLTFGGTGAFVSTVPQPGAVDRRSGRLRQSCVSLLLGFFSSRALRRTIWFDRGDALELFQCAARPAAGSAIDGDLSALRPPISGNHADRCLPFLLRLQFLWDPIETKGRRLLCVLQLRIRFMSAHSDWCGVLCSLAQ